MRNDPIRTQLWYPYLPPVNFKVTGVAGFSVGDSFTCMRPSIFLSGSQSSNHLSLINCFVSPRLLGIFDFHSNVDDQEPVLGYQWLQGKEVSLLIDGANGERLSGMDVLWSHRTDHIGMTVQQLPYPMRF